MRLDLWNVALLLAAPFAAACSEPVSCLLNVEPAVEVEVRDRITGDFLSTTPRGLVREGTFEDSLKISETTLELPPRVITLIAADERTGRYVVQVEADGYQAWDTTGVQVTADECHVRTARFTAALDPAP